jgi:hypothetical protein
MSWEQIGFCVFVSGYIMLSTVKTVDKYRAQLKKHKDEKKQQRRIKNRVVTTSVIEAYSEDEQEALRLQKKELNLNNYRFVKTLINYSVSFNSAFLIVGSLSEAYLYGVRMVGNIMSVSLGYLYSFLIVQPFMYSLDADIETPYHYFSKRYRNNRFVRAITAAAGMLFYFSFLSLYIWGCAILLSTLIPLTPLYVSSIIIGTFSMLGGILGGFTQSTKTNLFQFLILVSGLILTIYYSITSNKQLNFPQMMELAYKNKRTVFFDTSVDFTTRYTILNQLTSLSMVITFFFFKSEDFSSNI